jgi:hypothetical protein
VRSQKLGEVTTDFETIHDIARPRQVGSVHDIIPAVEPRPRLIVAVERGMEPAGRTQVCGQRQHRQKGPP